MNREQVIAKVRDYINNKGLEVKDVENNANGSVTITIMNTAIRSIGLKPFLNEMGIEARVAWDNVNFIPVADFGTINYSIASGDPEIKVEDVRNMLINTFSEIDYEQEELSVEQNIERSENGMSVFDFSLTARKGEVQQANILYMEEFIESMPGTRNSTLVEEYANSLEEAEGVNYFFEPELPEAEVLEANELEQEELEEKSTDELNELRANLQASADNAQNLGQGAIASSIRASVNMIDEVLKNRD